MNGILTVVARDKDGGNKESITITSDRNQLAKTEITRMMHEAQNLLQNDQDARARSPALNELQQLIAAKRPHLTESAELEEHSHWAETSGGVASLAELNFRAAQVGEMSTNPHITVTTGGVHPTTTVGGGKPLESTRFTLMSNFLPRDLDQVAGAGGNAKIPEMSVCAHVPPNAPIPHGDL
ncbi:hypothetical protein FRC08_000263 [Ceratobasidium sp. 394]|nr:hypothetical protein FRC08_000263 [Ceratobasidium sp. 394]